LPHTGRELVRAVSAPRELRTYDGDRALRSDEARRDRSSFLARLPGLAVMDGAGAVGEGSAG